MIKRHLPLLALFWLVCAPPTRAAAAAVIVQLSPTASLNEVLVSLGGSLVDAIPGTNISPINRADPPITIPVATLGIEWIEYNNSLTLPSIGQSDVLQISPNTAADWYKNQPAMQLTRSQQALSY